MKVGADLDGVISLFPFYNPRFRLPNWLFIFLVPFLSISPPKRKTLKALATMKAAGKEVIIITARPPWSRSLTERWLNFHKVPFDELFCVGFGPGTRERKIEVIEREGVKRYIDDDRGLVDSLKKSRIRAATHLR